MIYEQLKKYGYSDAEIDKILSWYPLSVLQEKTLLFNINSVFSELLLHGYTKKQILKMTINFPSIYSFRIERFANYIQELAGFGYTKDQVLKMTVKFSALFALGISQIQEQIGKLEELGYTKDQILKMTVSFPELYSLRIVQIHDRIQSLEELGYTKEQILKMTVSFPAIYGLSAENRKQKLLDMEELGYTREQVIKVTVSFPAIYGLTLENIKEKVEYFREIGIEKTILTNPKNLIQSVDLTYARYCYLKENTALSDHFYANILFQRESRFQKQFYVTKEELLEQYPYPRNKAKKKVKEY